MRYSDTKLLMGLWSSLRAASDVPAMADLRPQDMSRLLPRIFIADPREGGLAFRLAGEGLRELYRETLKGMFFDFLWGSKAEAVSRAVVTAGGLGRAVIVDTIATTEWDEIAMDTLVVPFASVRGGMADRFVGLQSYDLTAGTPGASAVRSVDVKNVTLVEDEGGMFRALERGRTVPALTLSVPSAARGHRIRRFEVIEGGRASA